MGASSAGLLPHALQDGCFHMLNLMVDVLFHGLLPSLVELISEKDSVLVTLKTYLSPLSRLQRESPTAYTVLKLLVPEPTARCCHDNLQEGCNVAFFVK